MSKKLNYYAIEEVAPLIEKKEVSPVELTQAVLDQIEKLDDKVNAYITVTKESALDTAKKAEEEIMNGNYRGPLHGIPMGIKDNIYFKNEKTTMGSKIHENFVPKDDAAVVSKFRKSGVVFTGKLNLHEYAWGGTTTNPHYGPCNNPWDLERIPGGSSGGSSASVMTHMSMASLGTDTGGSIRIPSSFVGNFGIKPTHGRVSKFGCFPLGWSLDHIGPMTKTVKDAAYLLESISGYDERDPSSANVSVDKFSEKLTGDVKGLRIGVNSSYFLTDVDEGVKELVLQGIRDLEKEGAEVVEVEIPGMENSMFSAMTTILSEPSAIHHDNLKKRPEDFGEDVKFLLQAGEMISAVEYIRAQQVRHELSNVYKNLFNQIDVLITPTLPFLPPKTHQNIVDLNGKEVNFLDHIIRFTSPFNITGLPAASINCGFKDGLPVGMQIVGKAFDEATVLNVAYAYEKTHPELKKDPPIV